MLVSAHILQRRLTMKAVEFAYWLQGYFEIDGTAPVLTTSQLRKINARAEAVQAGTDAAELSAKSYVDFTKGALSLLPPSGEADAGMARGISENLRTRLNDLFIHAIDPAIKGDQSQLRKTHRPDDDNKGGVVAMC
jgi:hypothetical protein